jgi:putative ABC transport system permease protein
MATLLQDLKFGARLLLKDRTFTITAVVTLALCIGANTAMFGIVRSVLLKPLPFPGSERLVLLYNSYPNAGAPRVGAAVPDYDDRLTAVPALDMQALFRRESMTYGDENGAERLVSLRATPSFYRMLQVQPAAGRVFTDDEGEPGRNAEVVLSYGFWQRKFGGDRAVVGRTVRLNGNPFSVVGVMPRDFTFLQNDIDLFTPAAFTPEQKSDDQRHSNNWQMIGRLRAGATMTQVVQQVDALNAHNDVRFPQFHQILKDAGFHTVAVFLQDDVVRDVRSVLYLLWGGVLFVLLIGGVNIANLVMVRASGRAREMATRHAIGGDLTRLARQLLTETTLLAAAGGIAGVLLGWWALRSVATLNLDQLPRGYEIGLDWMTLAVIVALTTLVGLLIGVAPVVRLWRMNLNLELREETRGGTSGRRAHLVRRALAMVQVGVALVLLIGAGLLLASFRAVLHLDFGFDPAGVATASVNLPATAYKDAAALVAFEQRALEGLRAIPGVEAAGATSHLPFSGDVNANVIMGEGHVMQPGESLLAPAQATVTAGYFEAMGIGLARGRAFDARDTAGAPRTAVIDERLAEKFWPGQDPIGRRLYQPTSAKDVTKITPDTRFFNVVGVVRNVDMNGPRVDFTPVGAFYFPFEQNPSRGLTFTVRTRGDLNTINTDIHRVLSGIDPQLPVFRQQPMQDWVDHELVGRRLPMLIAMAFGIVALLLAAVGIYGVLAYSVAQRQRELGVRMALGGSSTSVFGLVLRDGLTIVGVGLAAGLVGSVLVGQLMKSMLFGVTATNPLVIALVTLLLSAVALVASGIPALRASRINPIVVLGK